MPRNSTSISDSKINPPEIEKKNESPKTKDELRHEAIDGVLQLAQFGCIAFGDFKDAGAIGLFGPPMVDEAVKLANENAAIASKVDLLIEVGPYAGFVAAAIPFVAQLLVNRGMFKAEHFANAGVVPPEQLEMQMKTQMLEKAMETMQEQKLAQERFRKMQDEMLDQMNGDNPEKDNVQADAE